MNACADGLLQYMNDCAGRAVQLTQPLLPARKAVIWSPAVFCCAPTAHVCHQVYSTKGKHITHLAVCCAVLCCPLVCLLASASIIATAVLHIHGCAVNLAAAHTTCYMIHPLIPSTHEPLPPTVRPFTSLTSLGASTPDAYSHHIPHHATSIHSPLHHHRRIAQCSSAAHIIIIPSNTRRLEPSLQPLVSFHFNHAFARSAPHFTFCTAAFPLLALLTTLP